LFLLVSSGGGVVSSIPPNCGSVIYSACHRRR
jgi:hypothetical protein